MLFKLVLASFSCLAVEACMAKVEPNPSEQLLATDSVTHLQLSSVDQVTTRKQQQWQAFLQASQTNSDDQQTIPQEFAQNRILKDKSTPQTTYLPPVQPGIYMTLTPTRTVNALGNPIYELRLYANNQLRGVYTAVTGRAYTQTRNRHVAGTQAPLPDGRYTVNRLPIPGTNPEVGGRFLPIQPMFQTGRSALGIHFDPSFEKSRTEDGTEGCIALTNKHDLEQVLNYVRTYQPQYLEVNIQP